MNNERKRLAFDLVVWISAPLLVMSLLASEADATRASPPSNAAWRTECSACHVPYPASLLSASQWQRIMGSLGRHYGSDASLDDTATTEILTFLTANAGRDRGGSSTAALPRITASQWFQREHREVRRSPTSPAGAADCAACHPGAANGDFDEDRVASHRTGTSR